MAEKIRAQDQVGDVDVTAPMLAQCPHCKARLQAGTKFCAECGKSVAPGGAAKKVFCTGCGAGVAPGAKFCGGCGLPQG